MTQSATLAEFKAQFGTNEGRLQLLAGLELFLSSLQQNFCVFRVLAYGSFITKKEAPSDIDVMVHVCASPVDLGFNKFRNLQPLAPDSVDVFTLKLSMNFGPPQDLPTAEAMIDYFNSLEAHVAKGIKCQSAVELLLYQTGSDS